VEELENICLDIKAPGKAVILPAPASRGSEAPRRSITIRELMRGVEQLCLILWVPWIDRMDTKQSRKNFLRVVAIVGLGLVQSA
jgi:hypothetical protein